MVQIKERDKIMVPIIVVLSIIVPLLVFILLSYPENFKFVVNDSGAFPLFHASLNFTTAILLLVGYYFMRIKNITWHRNVMITAFVLSTIFLISYVISKTGHEPVSYGGEGFLKYIYYFILITHIVLSGIIVPLVLFTMYRGLTGQYEKHRKIARWTFPVWMYVAISGVLVYLFMAPYY